jgi:toxin YhaV
VPSPAPFSSGSWTILVHPLFLSQLAALIEEVQKARLKDPATFRDKNAMKRLAAILKLAFDVIP